MNKKQTARRNALLPNGVPRYGHIGKKIKWADLPPDCQKLVLSTYTDLWDIVSQPELFNQ